MNKMVVLLFSLALISLVALIWIQDEYGCPAEEGRAECILNIVENTKENASIILCEEIPEVNKKDLCYFRLVEYNTKDSLEACSKITDINISYYSKDNCYLKLAIEQNKRELCAYISSETHKELCYNGLGSVQ